MHNNNNIKYIEIIIIDDQFKMRKTIQHYVYYSIKNKDYYISKKNIGFFSYDFTDKNRMKIIEYNGDLYHGNPLIYEKNDRPNPFRKNITAEEMWQKDVEKIKIANDAGFEVLTIWDSEYRRQKEETLKKCKNYLNL
jgi:hypothetical protein